MHDVEIHIRCQRCGHQMELRDPAPDDAWTPQQFWECLNCGRHFWTTYPPPKAPAPPRAAKPVPPESDAGDPLVKPVADEAKLGASASPQHIRTSADLPSEEQAKSAVEKPE